MHCVDAGHCCRRREVAWSVCLSVSASWSRLTTASPAKTAEPIEISCGCGLGWAIWWRSTSLTWSGILWFWGDNVLTYWSSTSVWRFGGVYGRKCPYTKVSVVRLCGLSLPLLSQCFLFFCTLQYWLFFAMSCCSGPLQCNAIQYKHL